MKKFIFLFIIVFFCSSNLFAETITATLGGKNDDRLTLAWVVQEDGDLVGGSSSYKKDIGESGNEVANLYLDSLTLGGVTKTTLGSISGAWEDNGTTVTLTSAPTKFIGTISTGDLKCTRFTSDDYYGTTNAQNIDLSTNNAFKFIDNSDTLTFTATGNDFSIDSTDGGIIFALTDATDGTVDFQTNNDTDDYIQISTTTNQSLINFVGQNGKITAASGTIDFDNENLTTTGTVSSGATTVTSLIMGDDTLDVVVDDELRFASNDEISTIEAYGFEAKAGILQLTADQGDDAGDKWQIVSDTTNSMFFTNDTGVKDTHATVLTLAATGILTTTNDVVAVNDSAATNTVQDILKLTSSSTGTAAAGLGTGIVLHVEDAGGIEEQGSIDCALTTNTDAAEDADIIFSQNTAGTIAETLRLVAASSATTADSLQFTSNTTETDAVTDALVLKQATGTGAAGNGLGISFQPEDAGGAEEQVTIDAVLTTATDAAEDAALVIRQQTAGAIAETLRVQGASSATAGDTLEFTSNTTETDAVIDIVKLKTATGTATDGAGIGISFEPEDATGSEQQASIDIVQTTAARATNDTDFVFSQNVNGTITERLRFDADGANVFIGAGAAVDQILGFDGAAQDYYVGIDDTDDDLDIGLGVVPGTTPAISIDENQNILIHQNMTVEEINYAVDQAASDTYVMTLTPPPAAYTTGMFIIFKAVTANTGACTINVNGLGAKALLSLNDVVPPDNYIEAGSVVMAVYDGTSFQMIQPDANPA